MTGLLRHTALGCADLLSDVQLVHPSEKRPSHSSAMLNRKQTSEKKHSFQKSCTTQESCPCIFHLTSCDGVTENQDFCWQQLALVMASPSPQNYARQLETNTIVQFCSLCQFVKNSRKTKWSKGFQIVKCCIATRMHPVDLVPNNTH